MIQELAGSDDNTLQPGHTNAALTSRKLLLHSVVASAGGNQLMHSKLLKPSRQSPTDNRFVMEQLHRHQGA